MQTLALSFLLQITNSISESHGIKHFFKIFLSQIHSQILTENPFSDLETLPIPARPTKILPPFNFPAEKYSSPRIQANFDSNAIYIHRSNPTTTMGSSKKPQDATRQERKAKKRMLEDAVPDLPGDVEETADIEVAEKAGKKRKRDVEEDVIKDKERKVKNKDKKRRKKEAEDEEGGVALEVAEEVKAEKKEKSKKDKKAKSPAATEALEAEATVEAVPEEAGPKKSKKERKAERRAKEAAATGKSKDAAPVEESEPKGEGKVNGDTATNGTNGEAEKKSKKNNRNREKKRKGIATAANGSAVNSDAEKPAEQKDKKDARFICFIGTFHHFTSTTPPSISQG